jgi:hypothetical protein
MILSIFHWLLIISIILLPFSRKWVGGMWRWIFRQLGHVLLFVWKVIMKIPGIIWTIIKGIFRFLWMVFVK